MIYHTFPDLMRAYFEEHLKSKVSYATRVREAKWLLTLTDTPTRDDMKPGTKRKGMAIICQEQQEPIMS